MTAVRHTGLGIFATDTLMRVTRYLRHHAHHSVDRRRTGRDGQAARSPPRGPRAFAFIDAVTGQPHHLAVGAGPRHLGLLRDICDQADTSGDLIPEAVAALAVEPHCEVATLDRDFARFTSVRCIRPGG